MLNREQRNNLLHVGNGKLVVDEILKYLECDDN